MNNSKFILIFFAILLITGFSIDYYLITADFSGNKPIIETDSTDICIRLHVKNGDEMPAIELENKQS